MKTPEKVQRISLTSDKIRLSFCVFRGCLCLQTPDENRQAKIWSTKKNHCAALNWTLLTSPGYVRYLLRSGPLKPWEHWREPILSQKLCFILKVKQFFYPCSTSPGFGSVCWQTSFFLIQSDDKQWKQVLTCSLWMERAATWLRRAGLLTNERGEKLWSWASSSHKCGPGYIFTELKVLEN